MYSMACKWRNMEKTLKINKLNVDCQRDDFDVVTGVHHGV